VNQNKIASIKARIELVNNLTKLRDNFKGPHLIEPFGEHGWTHPYRHFSALRYYLLLTCFDILGSNNEFIPFSSWLNSDDKKIEREDILQTATDKELLGNINKVHSAYNKLYGTTQGFKRFINIILSPENKEKLLKSINVRKIVKTPIKVLEYTATESQKIDFLFNIRNSFTHAGESYAGPGGGLFKDPDEGEIIEGKRMWGHDIIYYDHRDEHYYEYSVRKWPSTLIEIIEDTITAS
jgi:hypothetical protein